MAEWLWTLIEVVIAVIIAVGVALTVASFAGVLAAIGAGLIVVGLLCGVLVVAAQLPAARAEGPA